jgi:hypothetical protein
MGSIAIFLIMKEVSSSAYEFEDRPFVHRKTISIDELTIEHIKEIAIADTWNKSDKMYPQRPSFYCLTITR